MGKNSTDLTENQYIEISQLYYKSLECGGYGSSSVNSDLMKYLKSIGRSVLTPSEAFRKARGIVENGIFALRVSKRLHIRDHK